MNGTLTLTFDQFDLILRHLKLGQYYLVQPTIDEIERQVEMQRQYLSEKRLKDEQVHAASINPDIPAPKPGQKPK